MKLAVFGPRDYQSPKTEAGQKKTYYNNYPYIADCLSEYDEASAFISGGGFGVEQLALRFAEESGILAIVVPPQIEKFGPIKAWPIRNKEIIEKCDLALVFWDGKDDYYHAVMAQAVELRKEVHLRHVE